MKDNWVSVAILLAVSNCAFHLAESATSDPEDEMQLKPEYDGVDPANQRRALAKLDEISLLNDDDKNENIPAARNDDTFEELLNDDLEDEDEFSTKLIRRAQTLSMKMLVRSMKVDEWQEDFDTTIIPAFRISNGYLYKLKDKTDTGINQQYRDLVVKLIAQAKENLKIIGKTWRKYRKELKVLESESGGAGLDALTKEYKSIKAEYKSKLENGEYEWGNFEKVTVRDCLDIYKASMPGVIKKESALQRLYFVFFAEQENLIKLGTNLWVNSQVDSEVAQVTDGMDKSESERELELYQKKLNERRKRAVYVYNNLRKRYEKNETTVHRKDEL